MLNHFWKTLQKKMSDIRTERVTRPRKGGKGTAASEIVVQRLTAGVCKTRTGYLRMADADGKMRIEKCG